MWHFISEQISQHIQQDFICDDIRNAAGGDSHQAYKISDGQRRFFVKTDEKPNLPYFEAEQEGLKHLGETGLFKVPSVICVGTVGDHSFLVLEHIPMRDGEAQDWFSFGQNLATMHQQHTQQMYGWQEDNFIGRSPQSNRWEKKWSKFFADQRIGYQLQMLQEKGHRMGDIECIVAAIERLLHGHQPVSSMLHGDLWQGNTGFYKQQPVIYDPSFYFGDRETDIAMSELFGRFPEDFYRGYEAVFPLDDGYQYRKSVYQLYHTLNHANIFGGHYLESAQSMLKNLDS